jgi:hypothetical protein
MNIKVTSPNFDVSNLMDLKEMDNIFIDYTQLVSFEQCTLPNYFTAE